MFYMFIVNFGNRLCRLFEKIVFSSGLIFKLVFSGVVPKYFLFWVGVFLHLGCPLEWALATSLIEILSIRNSSENVSAAGSSGWCWGACGCGWGRWCPSVTSHKDVLISISSYWFYNYRLLSGFFKAAILVVKVFSMCISCFLIFWMLQIWDLFNDQTRFIFNISYKKKVHV